MDLIIRVDIIGKKDSARAYRTIKNSPNPIINSTLTIRDGPPRRLNDKISILSVGFNFIVNSEDITQLPEEDIIFIVVEDSTNSNEVLGKLIKEYEKCGWEIKK